MGELPVDKVLTRPAPGPDSIDTVGRPHRAPVSDDLDPGPTRPVGAPPADPTDVVGQAAAPAPSTAIAPAAPGRRGRNPLLIATVAVVVIVTVTALALLFLRDGDSPDATTGDGASSTDPGGPADNTEEEVLATVDIAEAAEPVRVQLVHDGPEVALVLLLERDGQFAEVDREPIGCPYLESSFEPEVTHTGSLEVLFGWSNLGQEGYGEYGRVVLEIESLELYGVEDGYVCPTEA